MRIIIKSVRENESGWILSSRVPKVTWSINVDHVVTPVNILTDQLILAWLIRWFLADKKNLLFRSTSNKMLIKFNTPYWNFLRLDVKLSTLTVSSTWYNVSLYNVSRDQNTLICLSSIQTKDNFTNDDGIQTL